MTSFATAPRPDFITDEVNERFTIIWGLWAVLKLCADPNIKTVLDVGSGAGEHARLLRHFGKEVFTNDWKTDSDYPGDILNIDFDRQFDAVLCSHVLEHQRNVGLFLEKLLSVISDGGALSIAVPFHQQRGIVLGHLTVWSSHLLAYNLVQAGQNCAAAQCLEDNECTLFVHKKTFDRSQMQEKLWNETNTGAGNAYAEDVTVPWHDDLNTLGPLMPDGSMYENWKEQRSYGWNGSFTFPVPTASTKDIEILTNKQDEPVRLLYDSILARASNA